MVESSQRFSFRYSKSLKGRNFNETRFLSRALSASLNMSRILLRSGFLLFFWRKILSSEIFEWKIGCCGKIYGNLIWWEWKFLLIREKILFIKFFCKFYLLPWGYLLFGSGFIKYSKFVSWILISKFTLFIAVNVSLWGKNR